MRRILLAFLLLIYSCTIWAQDFQNLSFDQSCEDIPTGLCHWEQSWASKGVNILADQGGLLIHSTQPNAVGFTEQTLTFPAKGEVQLLNVQARIRTEAVVGKGAGLNLGIYDANDQLIYNADMGYGHYAWISGTKDWQDYQIKAILAPNATKIKIGAIVYGEGKSWFDDFRVDLLSVKGRKASPLAQTYVSAAMDTVALHSLRKDSVDLAQIKANALQIAGPAKTTADCHIAIKYILKALEDGHSFFMTPQEAKAWASDTPEAQVEVHFATHRMEQGYAYVSVPGFHKGSKQAVQLFADSLQRALHELDQQNPKGWIIDLRDNDGGNMEPMVAGLGPILEQGKLGQLIDVNGNADAWYYQDGRYYWDAEPEGLQIKNHVTIHKQRPIAVLYGSRTGSSGETTLLSFVGNPYTRSFGRPSWGLTTGNGEFPLADGAKMLLSSTVMADRTGKKYDGPIYPDVQIPKAESKEKTDPDLQAAMQWINDMDQILQNIATFSQAYMDGDYDTMTAAYTMDGKIFPSGPPIIEGQAAIRESWVLPEGQKVLLHKITPSDINILGDHAYDFGYYEGKTQQADGNISEWKGKYVIVWRKEDGKWKMYLDIWNRVR